jgi:hypothetical protein
MADIQTTEFASGILESNQPQTFFADNVDKRAIRWFTAVPLRNTPVDEDQNYDDSVEIAEVFYILKGDQYPPDGGAGTLQVNVTVQNRNPDHPTGFTLYQAEITVQ